MRIGIITIHRLFNYGTNLQAYALQYYISKEYGYTVEIIDYKYPNAYHKEAKGKWARFRCILGEFKQDLLYKRLQLKWKFKSFEKRYYVLSAKQYKSIKEIEKDQPIYDLYITGSDQVWNPVSLKYDPVMYCSFARDGHRRISFGASFAKDSISEKHKKQVQGWLNTYSHIGVREATGIKILQNLHLKENIKISTTCDPTLLLSADDYHKLAQESKIKTDSQYILVYMLGYAYNPEPALSEAISAVQKKIGFKVYVIGRPRHLCYREEIHHLDGVGPCDFLKLFENASFIITSSFHGTMFSIINRKPFLSILPNKENNDTRISDILKLCHLENCSIHSDETTVQIINDGNPYTEDVEKAIENYISTSKHFLSQSLRNE